LVLLRLHKRLPGLLLDSNSGHFIPDPSHAGSCAETYKTRRGFVNDFLLDSERQTPGRHSRRIDPEDRVSSDPPAPDEACRVSDTGTYLVEDGIPERLAIPSANMKQMLGGRMTDVKDARDSSWGSLGR